ncbi:hypothetical protein JCM10213_006942 [Rhodosporidiobolus nylandii]
MNGQSNTREQLPPSPDCLSSLPVEILSEIFELAYTPEHPSAGPISRALLPFDRLSRFRRIEVESAQQLRGLMQIAESNEGLFRLVKGLEISGVDGASGQSSARPFGDRQLKAFFATLTSLTHLSLAAGTGTLTHLVLTSPFARSYLPSLNHLAVLTPLDSKNPFDPSPFRYLSLFTSLTSLQVTTVMEERALRALRTSKKASPPLPSLQELTVISAGSDLPLVLPLLDACPALQRLTLHTETAYPDYPSLLAPFKHKANIESLTLRTWPFYDGFSTPCDALLPSFPSLKHLYLGEGTFSPSVFAVLRTLPRLSSLGFGRGALPSVKELSALTDGDTRFYQLETLTLDCVAGKIGWRTDHEGGGDLHPQADERWHTGPGWDVPHFTPSDGLFCDLDVEKMVKKAMENGVEVTGSTIEALEVMSSWYDELGDAAMAYGFETGDWEDARGMMGDDFVDDVLLGFDGYSDEYYDDSGYADGCYYMDGW